MTLDTLAWALAAAVLVFEAVSRFALSRRMFRSIAVFFILMEHAATRLVRLFVRPKFMLVGGCQKRGTCCEMIIGDPPQWVKESPRWLNLFAVYHRVFHNFHVKARGTNDEVIFECHHLQSDGMCSIYRLRPLICRDYPQLPLYDPPLPIPGCGFGVAPRVVARMKPRASLPILNPFVAVHHPTREGGHERFERPEDYELVDLGDAAPYEGGEPAGPR